MSKTAVKQARSSIAKKLKEFGRILLESKIIIDDKKIVEAANSCLQRVPDIKGIKYDKKNPGAMRSLIYKFVFPLQILRLIYFQLNLQLIQSQFLQKL